MRRAARRGRSDRRRFFSIAPARPIYAPAIVMPSTMIDPQVREPRVSESPPTATTLRNMSRRFPAMVISSTGYRIFPPSTQ